MATLRLDTPVKFLKGIGEKRAELFQKLGVETALDLLWHLPHRYLDASSITPLAEAKVGGEFACVGTVVAKRVVPFKRLRVFRAVLRDDSGVLECVWPGQPFLDRTIREGQTLLVTGPVKFYHGRQMAPREFVVLDEPDEDTAAQRHSGAGAQDESQGGRGAVAQNNTQHPTPNTVVCFRSIRRPRGSPTRRSAASSTGTSRR